MYKYFTWTQGDYFESHALVNTKNLTNLLSAIGKPSECMASMQDYIEDGTPLGSLLYFDIDSPSLYDAYQDMQELCYEIECEYGVTAATWFSGGKGFHVVAPLFVEHPRCHEICKMVADEIFPSVDHKVYRTKAMWRCNNSWNKKGKRYKIAVHKDMSLDFMINLAVEPHSSYDQLKWAREWDVNKLPIESYINRLPVFKQRVIENDCDFFEGLLPCMKKLWDMDVPPMDNRHQFVYLMARHCHRSGLTQDEAIAMFDKKNYKVNSREYEKVIRSTYRSGNNYIGCKHGSDAEFLKKHCQPLCMFNERLTLRGIK